jgi:ISXO2-like transposase domain
MKAVGARHRGVGGRQLAGKAAIAVEGDTAPERVRIKRISDVTRDTLTGFVLDNVARGSEVRTDAWTGYDDIGRFHFSHVVTNMSGSGDPAHVALPHVHIVASLLKRLDPGHQPRLDQPPPARLLPRRVRLPL